MKSILNKIAWNFDYYFVYLMYNEKKVERYHEYMHKKWNLRKQKSNITSISPIANPEPSIFSKEVYDANYTKVS